MSMDLEPAGALATAGLVAKEIEGDAGRTARGTGAGERCGNCNAQLAGPYCHQCGQSGHVHRSLLHLLEELAHGILHFDTRSWRTLPLLVARPGLLTRRYIEGQRTRYVSPLALFLFSVFLMFFVFSTVAGSNPNIRIEDAANERPQTTQMGWPATMERLAQEQSQTHPTFARIAHHAAENPDLTLYKLKNSAYKFAFMLIPISLPFLWVMFFWRKGVTMYDHTIFTLYGLSFLSLWWALIAVMSKSSVTEGLSGAAFLFQPVHLFMQLRETYSLGWFATLWRTVALLVAGGFVLGLFALLVLFISLD